jgi:hypothetical protein
MSVAALAMRSGMDRDRSFYPTVLIVVASYYALFAAMGASVEVLAIETAAALGFATLAIIGFKRNLWLVAAAIAGHGLFDMVHHWFIENPGVPVWWPGFCATVDVLLGAWVALRLWKTPASFAPPPSPLQSAAEPEQPLASTARSR